MARAVRTLSVNLTAGTAKFYSELDAAGAKVRQFGGHTVSSMQASSAAIRTLEGNFTNNVRAVERFVTSVLPLGPALQAAFPVVGAIALGGVVTEVGEKVYQFWKKVKNAGEDAAGAFRALNSPLRQANDELRVANDRLENDIAKLEGHHQNTLKLTLDEAAAAAERLEQALSRDLARANELLLKHENGIGDRLIGGSDVLKRVRVSIAGDDGNGGNFGAADRIIDEANQKISESVAAAKTKGTPVALKGALNETVAIRTRAIADAQLELGKAAKTVNTALGEQIDLLRASETGFKKDGSSLGFAYLNPELLAKDIKALQGEGQALQQMQRAIPERLTNDDLDARLKTAQAAHDNRMQDKPFSDRMKAMSAQLDGLKAKLAAIGKGEEAQVLAKAFGESQKIIEEVNKALERHNTKLTEGEKAQIRSKEATIAQTEADVEWRTKLAAATTSIEDRIKSQQMLTDAIGRGYEAIKQANVETRLMAEMKQAYNDPAHAADATKLRGMFGQEFDTQHAEQVGQAVQKLKEQIELEKALAGAQLAGAEAVRQATLAVKLRQMAIVGATKAEMEAEIELYNLQRANAIAGDVAKLNEKTAATERLTAATLKGADALRKATLANELSGISREGDIGIPGVFGIGQRGLATVSAEGADHSKELAAAAARADHLQALTDEIAKLREARDTLGDTIQIEISLRDLENQRLKAMAEQSLQLRGLRDGVRAFFIEMQADAKSAASIVYDAMHSALDQSTANLAKMLTEKKPKGGWGQEWGKELQGIGQSMVQSSLKSLAQLGLGALGQAVGIDLTGLGGKPDGTAAKPFWVRLAGANGSPGPGYGSASGGGNAPGSANTGTGDWGGEVTSDSQGVDLSKWSGGLLRAAATGKSPAHGAISSIGALLSKLRGASPGELSEEDAALGTAGGDKDTLDMWRSMATNARAASAGYRLSSGLVNRTGDTIDGVPSMADDLPWGGFMAGGGEVTPGVAYSIEQSGTEKFVPSTPGRIVPGGVMGANHVTNNYAIDARGADLGAHNRIARALEMTHRESVSGSVLAVHERARRTPGGK